MKCQLETTTVYYETYGEGRPIVMLHGFSPDHRLLTGCMEPILRQRAGWRRIYPDLPGMGQTPASASIAGSDQMLDVVSEFIDAIIPNEHFLLVGESYGGYLARGVVCRKRDLVEGLLLICPLITADPKKRTLPRHITLLEDSALLSSLKPEEAEDFKSIAVVQTPQILERYRKEIYSGVKIADEAFLTRLQTEHYAFSFDVDTLLGVFEKPSLILVGRQDSSVGYRDAWTILENYPRGAFAVIDRAGHNLQIEQEKLFNAHVNEWLDRVEECAKSL